MQTVAQLGLPSGRNSQIAHMINQDLKAKGRRGVTIHTGNNDEPDSVSLGHVSALVAQQHDSALAAISSTAHKQADGHECPTERDKQRRHTRGTDTTADEFTRQRDEP